MLINPPAIGGPIAFGTLGSVLFAGTGGLFAQDNSNFFWDDSANRLGIGTAAPGVSLEVAGDVYLRSGVSPRTLKIFNTDDGAGNTEALRLDAAANVFHILTESAGTGTPRQLSIGTEGAARVRFIVASLTRFGITTSGHLEWPTTNTYDIGVSGAVPRDLLLGRDAIIGGTLSLPALTQGSVLFVGATGLVSQDNTNLFWNDTDNSLILAAAPPASATKASLLLGAALSGGDADGTFIGINAPGGYAGDMLHLQVNNASVFRVFGDGSTTIGSNADLYKLTLVGAAKNGIYHAVLATAPVAGDVLFYAAVSGTVTGDIRAFDCSAACTGDLNATFYNTNATSNATATFMVQVLNGSSGDPKFTWSLAALGVGWTAGLDNSDSDKWKLVAHYFLDAVTPAVTIDRSNLFAINTASPAARFHSVHDSAVTNAVEVVTIFDHNTSGTAAAGFGSELRFRLESSTTADQNAAGIQALWSTATHASRLGDLVFNVYEQATAREALRLQAITGGAQIVIPDAVNVALNTGTGTRWGTSASQKQGWYNAPPVVQGSAWSATNVTTDRAFDANAVTIDELADVVGTLIADLQTKGLAA